MTVTGIQRLSGDAVLNCTAEAPTFKNSRHELSTKPNVPDETRATAHGAAE